MEYLAWNKRKSCEGCIYYRPLSAQHPQSFVCHYCLFEDNTRDCPPDKCDKKLVITDAEERRKKLQMYYQKNNISISSKTII